jgi:hypothetical protein
MGKRAGRRLITLLRPLGATRSQVSRSAAIGIDDSSNNNFNRTPIINAIGTGPNLGNAAGAGSGSIGFSGACSALYTAVGCAYGGTSVPDLVGSIRVDQTWGLFQISGAVHDNHAGYFTNGNVQTNAIFVTGAPQAGAVNFGHPSDVYAGAVMTALQIKNIPTGLGDDFKIDATYSKGNTKQVISTSAASPVFAMFGGSNRAYQSIGFGATSDAIWLPVAAGGTGDLKLTEAFGVRGAFNHNWDPFWSSSLFGSWSAVRYSGSEFDLTTARGQFCLEYIRDTGGIAAKSADFSCNPNFNVYQIGFITRWTPVKNLTFSAEVMYTRLDQNFTGTSVLAPSAPKPTTVYEFKDQDTASFNVRVQRNF